MHVDAVGRILVLSSIKRIVGCCAKPIGGGFSAPVIRFKILEGVTPPSSFAL